MSGEATPVQVDRVRGRAAGEGRDARRGRGPGADDACARAARGDAGSGRGHVRDRRRPGRHHQRVDDRGHRGRRRGRGRREARQPRGVVAVRVGRPARGAGVQVALQPDGVARCLRECGIAFMFAPVFHPAMAHAAVPRREMGIPTVFNFLGPLTNPARPAGQVVGVADPRMLPVLAGVLSARATRAFVVRGGDGIDELTTTGPSTVYRDRRRGAARVHVRPGLPGVAAGSSRGPGGRRRGGERRSRARRSWPGSRARRATSCC